MIFCLLLLAASLPCVGQAQDSTLVDFTFKDQFGTKYTESSWGDSTLVFVGSDKDGSPFNKIWGRAIHDSLQAQAPSAKVRIIGISDLRGVPFFLKGFVRGKFPKEPANWVLMDWKGRFAKKYEFQKGMCNILVFSSTGRLVLQTFAQEFDMEKLQQIIAGINMTLH